MTKTALGFYDPGDEWRRLMRMTRGFQLPQSQLHETLKAIRGPNAAMKEAMKGFQTNAELQKGIRAAMPQGQMQAQMRETLKGFQTLRIADQQWRDVLEQTTRPQHEWQAAFRGFQIPEPAVRQLIDAARLPHAEWQRVIRGMGAATNSALVARIAETFEAELATVEPVADPDHAGTSWVWNLAFEKQLGLLAIALEVLDVWNQWLLLTFSDEELPPELTQTTRLMFVLIAALSMVLQLRAASSSDDDDE